MGISLAGCMAVFTESTTHRFRSRSWGLGLLLLLFSWVLLQLVPLPPGLVAKISPARWVAASAARAATGQEINAWLAVSVAPPATVERLLDLLPALTAFVAVRQMASWWSDRIWLAVAPVVAVAWLESLLALVQFYFMRMAGGDAASATGTYVNRNHFAGLLEMGLPLAFMAAIHAWKKGSVFGEPSAAPALRACAFLAIAACILIGVIISLSRTGFVSTLAVVGVTTVILLLSRRVGEARRRPTWLWILPIAAPLCALVFLSTKEMVSRFAEVLATEEISKGTRLEIWNDTQRLIAAYPWTGCGLGAYERGLFQFKTAAPVYTVDFAHNDYLQIISELGWPGAVIVALIAGWILWRIVSVVLFGRGGNWELGVGLLGVFLALALHSLADFNLYIPANALAVAWLGGVAVSSGLSKQ
jgi:O-antigen ligase